MEHILVQLRDFADFYGTTRSLFPDSRATAKLVVKNLIEKHLFYVDVEPDQKIRGFICGVVTPHMLNPDIICLAETLWWVQPAARGSRTGAKLLQAFLDWGLENADWITMTLEHHSPLNPTTLTRRGFKLQESAYILEVL